MAVDQWQNVKKIFLQALELDETARSTFVNGACRGDDSLSADVLSLLASHEQAGDRFESPIFDVRELLEVTPPSAPQRFGPYTIIREIGVGGMGAVFLAERSDGEFEQQVALKIVRQSIADSRLIENFRDERQILARLSHPNIARLLDGGVSSGGEPFLVMEYVVGIPVTEHVRRNAASIRERLKIFLKICSAVAYAHRSLVVHRDIKPGNILVTEDGEPKLLDFGLARLASEDLSPDRSQTAFRAMTPAYASPEQLSGKTITTLSDVYSLGIVLYELLSGSRPFATDERTVDQILRSIEETEPKSPSKLAGPASSELKGDLDNIVLKCIRLEPSRRYASVDHLASDIERYLDGRPVSARPNTFGYRSGKFIGRHKASTVAALLLIAAIAGGTWMAVANARAVRREKDKAIAVNTFLQNMLNYSDTSSGQSLRNGHDATVKDVLNDASAKLDSGALSSQPEIRAELERIVGGSYLSQGNYDLGEKHLESALQMQKLLYGENSPETLPTLVELGELYLSQLNYEAAQTIYTSRLAILRRGVENGSISPDYLLVALNDFAVLKRAQGDSSAAEIMVREGVALEPRISEKGSVALGSAKSVLALSLTDEGRFDEAENIVRSRIEQIRQMPNPQTPQLASNLTVLGGVLEEKGQYPAALEPLVEAETLYRKLYGPSFMSLADNLRIQAQTYYELGDLSTAGRKIDDALDIYAQHSPDRYINYPTALSIRGMILNKQLHRKEAEAVLTDALARRAAYFKPEHFLYAFSAGALGECLMDQEEFGKAEPLLRLSYESLRTSQGETGLRTVAAKARLQDLYSRWKGRGV